MRTIELPVPFTPVCGQYRFSTAPQAWRQAIEASSLYGRYNAKAHIDLPAAAQASPLQLGRASTSAAPSGCHWQRSPRGGPVCDRYGRTASPSAATVRSEFHAGRTTSERPTPSLVEHDQCLVQHPSRLLMAVLLSGSHMSVAGP
jgi:hypothetical protein